jgi:hypothetical protein
MSLLLYEPTWMWIIMMDMNDDQSPHILEYSKGLRFV